MTTLHPATDLAPRSRIPSAGVLAALRGVFGSSRDRRDIHGVLARIHQDLGDVARLNVTLLDFVNLFGPDANRLVLLDRERIFSAQLPWTRLIGHVFGGGLLLRDGDDHKHHRALIHQAFRRPRLAGYVETQNRIIDAHVSRWPSGAAGLQAWPAFKSLTLELAAAIFLGVDLERDEVGIGPALEAAVAASMSRVRLPLPGFEYYRGLQGRKKLMGYFRELVQERRSADGDDMLSLLCRAEDAEGRGLTDDEIAAHLVFLMMAAHDTTTSALTSITYELGRDTAWQERVRDESRALGSPGLAFADRERLESAGWVLQEALRRYPPLPVIPRVATRAFEFGGYRIPDGTMVLLSPIHTHHMPEWWSEPWRFDPGRFAPERAEHERHSHSWVPFGGGPHHCLGIRFAELQVKAVLHHLVLAKRWEMPHGYTMPVQQAPISRPLDGLPVTFEAAA